MSPFAVFLTIVLLVWAAMHAYVFWRISTLPMVSHHVPWWAVACAGLLLWLSFPISKFLESRAPEFISLPLEYFAANWLGILFLLLCAFLATDIFSLGGLLWSSKIGQVRTAAAAVGLALSVVALIQGHRDPVVTATSVELKGLPPERDGTVVIVVSDVHLGMLIRENWTRRLVTRINDMKPDLIVAVGDIVDGNEKRAQPMSGILKQLHAPLGVWSVTGNHDYYAGVEKSLKFLENAGMTPLRDSCAELAPGLVLAGVDDLTARAQFGTPDHPVEKALLGRPEGATILLSHTPWDVHVAARNGANLMLSGHTHNGQIWPFTYMVRTRYPYVSGHYNINGMTLIVCRGTATWGPRMRLWHRGEILHITLRSESRR